MPEEYSKDQLWKLYEKLPEELQEAIFSGESADNIDNICARNSIDNLTAEVAKYAGRVLMGILSPADFQKTLEKELKLEEPLAKKVSQEINRFIFFPVKKSLNSLYKIETPSEQEMLSTVQKETASVPEPPTEKSLKSDAYRETLE